MIIDNSSFGSMTHTTHTTIKSGSLSVFNSTFSLSELFANTTTYSIERSHFHGGNKSTMSLLNAQSSNFGKYSSACPQCVNTVQGFRTGLRVLGPDVTIDSTRFENCYIGLDLTANATAAILSDCERPLVTLSFINTSIAIVVDTDGVQNGGVTIDAQQHSDTVGIDARRPFRDLVDLHGVPCAAANSINVTRARPSTTRPSSTKAARSQQAPTMVVVVVIVVVLLGAAACFIVLRRRHSTVHVQLPSDENHRQALDRLALHFSTLPSHRSPQLDLAPHAISAPLRLLGEGAFGEVHHCKLTLQGGVAHDVAVKTLKAANVLELASNEYVDEKLIQFYLESEALLRMQHPHVVRGVGLQRMLAPMQLCLEYCDGGDLVHYLRGCSEDTSGPMLTEMAAQVAAGVKVGSKISSLAQQ